MKLISIPTLRALNNVGTEKLIAFKSPVVKSLSIPKIPKSNEPLIVIMIIEFNSALYNAANDNLALRVSSNGARISPIDSLSFNPASKSWIAGNSIIASSKLSILSCCAIYNPSGSWTNLPSDKRFVYLSFAA